MKQRLFALLAATAISACSAQSAPVAFSREHPASPNAPEGLPLGRSNTLDGQVMSPALHGGVTAARGMAGHDSMSAEPDSRDPQAKKVYSCPMHSQVKSGKPGSCPKCGMPLRLKVQLSEQGMQHGH